MLKFKYTLQYLAAFQTTLSLFTVYYSVCAKIRHKKQLWYFTAVTVQLSNIMLVKLNSVITVGMDLTQQWPLSRGSSNSNWW